MTKFLAYLLPLFVLGSAYADDVKDLPPQASGAAIIIFLVLFFGSCAGFVAMVWWRSKSGKDKAHEQEVQNKQKEQNK